METSFWVMYTSFAVTNFPNQFLAIHEFLKHLENVDYILPNDVIFNVPY